LYLNEFINLLFIKCHQLLVFVLIVEIHALNVINLLMLLTRFGFAVIVGVNMMENVAFVEEENLDQVLLEQEKFAIDAINLILAAFAESIIKYI